MDTLEMLENYRKKYSLSKMQCAAAFGVSRYQFLQWEKFPARIPTSVIVTLKNEVR